MAAKFKKGDSVRQVLPAPVAGTVVQLAVVEDDLGYLVQMPNGNQRWFKGDELEAVQADA